MTVITQDLAFLCGKLEEGATLQSELVNLLHEEGFRTYPEGYQGKYISLKKDWDEEVDYLFPNGIGKKLEGTYGLTVPKSEEGNFDALVKKYKKAKSGTLYSFKAVITGSLVGGLIGAVVSGTEPIYSYAYAGTMLGLAAGVASGLIIDFVTARNVIKTLNSNYGLQKNHSDEPFKYAVINKALNPT